MNQQQFDALASQGYSHIPVVHEILADLDTPLSTYLKVADAPYSYLLESGGQSGEKWGRYSIIGLPARTVIRVRGTTLTVEEGGEVVEETQTEDPLAFVEAFSRRFNVPDLPDLPRFFGGLVGYFGYDTIRYVEKRLKNSTPPDDMGTPDILLMVSSDVIVFDNVAARMKLISLVEPSRPDAFQTACETLETRARQLDAAVPRIAESAANQPVEESDFESAYGRAKFMDAVEQIRDYIKAGDVMQVVLSQRMSIPFASPPDQPLSGATRPEPFAVHVLHESRRLPHRQLVARDPGPGRKRHHRQPATRWHAPTRTHGDRRSGDGARAGQ